LNCSFAATSLPNEWQEYYSEFHFSGTGGNSADRYSLFQRLRRCTNVKLASARNSDLIDNECLAANISITAPPAWEITRAVMIVFQFNILHENPVQVPLKHLTKIVETVVSHCDSKPKWIAFFVIKASQQHMDWSLPESGITKTEKHCSRLLPRVRTRLMRGTRSTVEELSESRKMAATQTCMLKSLHIFRIELMHGAT
jgi:hypothetical protein